MMIMIIMITIFTIICTSNNNDRTIALLQQRAAARVDLDLLHAPAAQVNLHELHGYRRPSSAPGPPFAIGGASLAGADRTASAKLEPKSYNPQRQNFA